MKTTVTFEVDDEAENGGSLSDLRRVMKVNSAFLVLWDFDQYLRQRIKYPSDGGQFVETYETIREALHEMLHDNGINLDADL